MATKSWYIDVPPADPEMEWSNVATFDNKKDAIKFVQKYYGADKEGKVSLISYFDNDSDDEM